MTLDQNWSHPAGTLSGRFAFDCYLKTNVLIEVR